MRIAVCAVGRKGPFDAQVSDYLGRAAKTGRALGLSGFALSAVEAPKAMSGAVRQAREAELLLGALPDASRVVMLDEGGRDLTSRAFAELIGREREAGAPALAFVIGGADGFDDGLRAEVRPRLAATAAFGRTTWPHMLARVMLAEQLYRATTILTGHPYHRD